MQNARKSSEKPPVSFFEKSCFRADNPRDDITSEQRRTGRVVVATNASGRRRVPAGRYV